MTTLFQSLPLVAPDNAAVASGFLNQAFVFPVTDQFVYVADSNFLDGGTIKKLPITGGFPERLYAPSFYGADITALATDGSYLYFADSLSGNILKMFVTGGTVTPLTPPLQP